MCRHLAYLGPPVSLASVLLEPPQSLLVQSYAPRHQQRGRFNADGFGAGWYDHGVRPEPVRYRRAVPMWSDRNFASLAGVVRAGAFLAAVRNATPPSPSEETSTAPFVAGPWLFAHNGEVADWQAGARRALLAGVSERRAAGIEGTADSEVLFAMALDRLDAGASAPQVLAEVVSAVLAGPGGRLNLVLTDGHQVAATACGDSLYLLALPGGGVVVASEPYDEDPGWSAVPDGSVVSAVPGAPAQVAAMAP